VPENLTPGDRKLQGAGGMRRLCGSSSVVTGMAITDPVVPPPAPAAAAAAAVVAAVMVTGRRRLLVAPLLLLLPLFVPPGPRYRC
jgi:hypothetical protein